MPLGFQWLPGAPSDSSQPEQPSFLELLGTLAKNVYSGDSRYSAAAGLGAGAEEIFGGMRERRQKAQQAKLLQGLLPDVGVPLDKLAGAGIEMNLGNIAELQKLHQESEDQKQIKNYLEKLFPTTPTSGVQPVGTAAPAISAGIPQIPLSQWVQGRMLGIPLPEKALEGAGTSGKYPTTNQIFGGWQLGVDPATGQARVPQTPEDYRKLGEAIQKQRIQEAVNKGAAEAGAKQAREGVSKSLAPATRQKLAEWGVAPEAVKSGDPLIGEATDATGMEKARATMNKQHQQVLESGDKSLQLIQEVRGQLQNVMNAGYSPMMLQAWAKVYDLQQKPEQNKGMIADLERLASTYGPIPEDVASFFDLIGQLRVTSNQAYAASLATRAVSAQAAAQSHIPTNYTDLGRVSGQLDRAENLLRSAVSHSSTTTAKREHLIEALRRAHPDWPYSRAGYLVDKSLGLKPERDNGPTVPVAVPAGGEDAETE